MNRRQFDRVMRDVFGLDKAEARDMLRHLEAIGFTLRGGDLEEYAEELTDFLPYVLFEEEELERYEEETPEGWTLDPYFPGEDEWLEPDTEWELSYDYTPRK